MTTEAGVPMQRSSRDPEVLRARLESWLGRRPGVARDAHVDRVAGTDANGMSSDTVLFDATWVDDDGTVRDEALVARIAPDVDDVPVFPSYDMAGQFATIET